MRSDPSRGDSGPGTPPRLRGARRRPVPLLALTCLLMAAGALTLLAGCSISLGGSAHKWIVLNSATSTASAGNRGEGLGDGPRLSDNSTPTAGQGSTALSTTPTVPPYTGHNYLSVGFDLSSCHPGAVSPYPYLNVGNESQTISMSWRFSISNGAYSLRASPPNPIPAGTSEFWAFVGPMSTTAPLYVNISGSIGSWSGTLQACSVQSPPTPTPFVTFTPSLPTQQVLPIMFTCAQAVAAVSAQLCIHTLPNAIVGVDSVNYACSNTSERTILTAELFNADANGNYTWQWVPNTNCQGSATASVSGSWFDGTNHIQYKGTTTTTFQVQ